MAEIEQQEPEKPIQVFLPALDPDQRGIIESSLDTEDENEFCLNLVKLQKNHPVFMKSKEHLERIYLEIKDELEQQQEEV